MLLDYYNDNHLPQTDLVYLAFRIALERTVVDMDFYRDAGEEPDGPVGYLTMVPFLEETALPVQVDLLAETWSRHRSPRKFSASLLDAAIVYAACEATTEAIEDDLKMASVYVREGPREIPLNLIRQAPRELEKMFDQFWDDRDFLLIEDFQDVSPERANPIKEFIGMRDEMVESLYDALGQGYVSPHVAVNLDGLMTPSEIQYVIPLLHDS